MKTKYLFGMLLSGAMLAACTADDFDTAPVAQKTSQPAPVFTVSYEDGEGLQNRAIYGSDGNLSFEAGKDLLSLFHGTDFTYSSATIATTPDLTGWQNAVYKGEIKDDQFKFGTESLVNPGLAVLVYPADTKFENAVEGNVGTDAPKVRIPKIQDEKTRELTPYMSEILYIEKYGTVKPNAVAGYGEEYDVILKRVASTLTLDVNIANSPDLSKLSVPAIAVKEVELTTTGSTAFTTAMPVMVKMNSGSPVRPNARDDNKGLHKSWYAVSELNFADATNIETSPSILTSHVTNTNETLATAVFTLLPFGKANNTDTNYKEVGTASAKVYTNYGYVEVSATEEAWVGRAADGDDTNKTIGAGIDGIASNMWYNPGSGTFKNENVGVRMTRAINIDMSKLQMNGLHVQNEEELLNAIAVYKELKPRATDPITFYLDGDDDGVFEMTNGTWEAVNAQYSAETSPIKCEPCSPAYHECKVVRLKNTKTAAEEVPALTLAGSGVPVVLEGNWKYTNITAADKVKGFEGVSKLVVLDGSVLELNNYIAAKGTVSLENEVGGTINVNGNSVILKVETTNSGEINIAEGAKLTVAGDKTLTNNGSVTDNATGLTTTEVGTINNAGSLSCMDNTSSKILNYGVINQKTAKAKTLITENATTSPDLMSAFKNAASGANMIGTINLFDETATFIQVYVNGEQGFIKQTMSKKNPTVEDFSEVANYVVVEGEYTTVEYAAEYETDQSGTVTKVTDTKLPQRVRYLEIGDVEDEVYMKGNFTFTTHSSTLKTNNSLLGMIVPAGKVVNMPSTCKVTMATGSCLYVKGDIYYSGSAFVYTPTTTRATFGGYFGGNSKTAEQGGDAANVHQMGQ